MISRLLLFILTILIQPAFSVQANQSTLKQPRISSTSPQSIEDLPPYRHQNVAAQIKAYREVYDRSFNRYNQLLKELDEGDLDILTRSFHIPGLYSILLKGFSLVKDKINPSSEKGKLALKRLQKIFKISNVLENKRQMSQHNFIHLNIWLAAIVDDYKGTFSRIERQPPVTADYSSNYKIALSKLDQGIINYSNLDFIPGHNVKAVKFYPPIIIYTKGGTALSYETFVNQTLAEPYGCFLALFDASLMPYYTDKSNRNKLGDKSSPHFSIFGGTTLMLAHDIGHEQLQSDTFNIISKQAKKAKQSINWYDYIKIVNYERMNLPPQQKNEKEILTRFLFLVTHEIDSLSGGQDIGEFVASWHPPFLDVLFELRKNMLTLVSVSGEVKPQENKFGRGSYYYKRHIRDLENILKGINDIYGNPLWPEYSEEEKSLKFKDRPHWPSWYKKNNLPQEKQLRRITKTEAFKYSLDRFWESVIMLVAKIEFFKDEFLFYQNQTIPSPNTRK